MSVEITSRKDLYGHFQSRIKDTQESLEEDLSLEHEKNMLKTFIIESNVTADTFLECSEYFDKTREIESELFELAAPQDDSQVFYLDTRDERFWSLYTLIGSQAATQRFEQATTTDQNGLDRLWLPNATQRTFMEGLGEFKGAGMKQTGKDAFPPDFGDVQDMRLDLNGEDAKHFYAQFKEHIGIEKELSLSRIIVRSEDDATGEYVNQRITNSGAFTACGGNNIQIHIDTVKEVKQTYRTVVEAIEANHRLSYDGNDTAIRVNGEHLTLRLAHEIPDLDTFTSHLVDSKEPFRLVGPTTTIAENYRKVRAVDLHNGDKVTLEVTPSEIRIYLDETACGNTALRIFTNIQRHFDPAATLEVAEVDDV